MNAANHLGRIRWKCRRGMLELDLMLLKFLDHHYQDLNDEERKQFESLLEEPDPVLQEYLYGLSVPANPELQKIVTKMRVLA